MPIAGWNDTLPFDVIVAHDSGGLLSMRATVDARPGYLDRPDGLYELAFTGGTASLRLPPSEAISKISMSGIWLGEPQHFYSARVDLLQQGQVFPVRELTSETGPDGFSKPFHATFRPGRDDFASARWQWSTEDTDHGAVVTGERRLTVHQSPAPPAPEEGHVDGRTYVVFYGTNRRRVANDDPSRGYTTERSSEIDYGSCRVFVPKSHKIGSLGSGWLKRLLKGNDDRLKLVGIDQTSREKHWMAMQSAVALAPDDARHAVVFIHGYNVSFEAASLRAAQIGFDLSIQGAMAFFSWPSQETLGGYSADESTIEASEDAITNYLTEFAAQSGARSVHVIAHSMGNRALLRAVNRIIANADTRSGVRFSQFILAAADVDADVFRSLSSAYASLGQRTTLYVSERDRAVELSHWLHKFPRVGFLPPIFTTRGVDTVTVSHLDMTLLGHGYVAEARDVLQDMHELIHNGTPPSRRFGLHERKTEDGSLYWEFAR